MGEVDTIYGYAWTLARKIEVEDTCVAALKFKNGAIGVIEGTTSVSPRTFPIGLRFTERKALSSLKGKESSAG